MKDVCKSFNNSLFGKTMEDVRKRRDLKLATSVRRCEQLCRRVDHADFHIFNEHLTAHSFIKKFVTLNKPIFIGQCVPDISKLTMYRLRYDHLGPRSLRELQPGVRVEVLGSDTDSLFLEVAGIALHDFLKFLKDARGILYTSNYPREHLLYSTSKKARLGCIKDESDGIPHKQWCLLKPKLYSMLSSREDKSKMRAKGVQRATIKHELTHQDYLDAYANQTEKCVEGLRINSECHQLFIWHVKKRGLSFFDDKRCWMGHNSSLPYGHYSLKQQKPNKPPIVPPVEVPAAKHEREAAGDDDDEVDGSSSRKKLRV